ncbi:Restriction enzyme BgcI subunit alpha [Serratia marcescens]|uniref:N-6 DNA methylase n=1 Tax=Serratia marcescens TaxID=615 RepID=UPI00217C4B2B|nr:N-6 DNA methylase [Serratia marcescens]CAI1699258.1 Restriction enzyme BgcI subunit alpha [Serratia marcescens]
MDNFKISISEDGKIIDFIDGSLLEPTPEEHVRQYYLRVLHYEYLYPKTVLSREVTIYYGSSELKDKFGNPVRADIVIYKTPKAKKNKDQGGILLVVECKAPKVETGYNQLVSYIYNTSAEGGIWFNGTTINYFRRFFTPTNELIEWTGIPVQGESWDELSQRKKTSLKRPKDIKGLLRQCHNKLHGRGIDGDEDDLTMDMVRIILAKAMDEEKTSEFCEFYCSPEEYNSPIGQQAVAERVYSLFSEVVSQNRDVFSDHEKISVGPRAICDVVVELQRYRLLSDLHESHDWDIMGHAYEQYTATYLKKSRGQFFTNRLVVDFLAQAIDPDYTDIILDPAGGSGGFLTGAMRHVRKKILTSAGTSIAKQRQLDKHRTNLFMVEISKRLVKIAKTAMILNGDGHTGMTQGDSLGPIADLNERVVARCGAGSPNIILTNPPFAGVGEGRISDKNVLDNFQCGIRWTNRNGQYLPTNELVSDGIPPEMLFLERCLQWIAPGGKIGIIMPKSFLDTQTYYPLRHLILEKFKLLAVINCHKNTFQPHTGVRTCVVIIQRPKLEESVEKDYSIFMAISKKIGQDSEGLPIFKRGKNNEILDEIDHDLDEILSDFKKLKTSNFEESEYRFSILKSEIDSQLRINPQVYLPNLNETIKQIESIDGLDGWSVTTLGQISNDIRIFKGPRLKSENLIVEEISEYVEKYYTPSAILQEKSDSAKLLNLKFASQNQLSVIDAIRVYRGDIVITRSGTIGRVAYITKRLDGAIVSDDLIRVRIKDHSLRLYVYQFLMTDKALNQMLRNEYGAVQQHLEPNHIANILIPIPEDLSIIDDLINRTEELILAKEKLESKTMELSEGGDELLGKLITAGLKKHEN